jgi:hypothetical protein
MNKVLWVAILAGAGVVAQDAPINLPLSLEQKEQFLKSAKLEHSAGAKKGVTSTLRATLKDSDVQHDASIQLVDEEKAKYATSKGTELGFRDCWKFNIAAYRLGRLLGLGGMIPPSVERKFDGKTGAYTWWIEDVQIDEMDRLKRHIDPPDKDLWARQYQIMKVFDQLIANVDRNQTNILYDKEWRLWMIDHSRAFRISKKLLDEKQLERCDRELLEKMKALTMEQLKAELTPYIRNSEMTALLARRDTIVEFFESHPEKMYDYLTVAKR